jgi:hypothetical protein
MRILNQNASRISMFLSQLERLLSMSLDDVPGHAANWLEYSETTKTSFQNPCDPRELPLCAFLITGLESVNAHNGFEIIKVLVLLNVNHFNV